jgi:hypothetical protein
MDLKQRVILLEPRCKISLIQQHPMCLPVSLGIPNNGTITTPITVTGLNDLNSNRKLFIQAQMQILLNV